MLLMLLPGRQYPAKTDVFYVYNPGFCLVFGVPFPYTPQIRGHLQDNHDIHCVGNHCDIRAEPKRQVNSSKSRISHH